MNFREVQNEQSVHYSIDIEYRYNQHQIDFTD
jgi:hypothetical protein